MITLFQRGGAGIHTLSALLDYCTIEGGLDGFPVMLSGDNLHAQGQQHNKVPNKFYHAYGGLHLSNDNLLYKKNIHGRYSYIKLNKLELQTPKVNGLTFAPISKNDYGRLLIFTMSIGKTYNKKLPPDDDRFDYSQCLNFADRIELISLAIADQLKMTFAEFFAHDFPTYHIDILWYWQNPEKICTVIEQCGWTPIVEKVYEFCKRVTVFNQSYYNMIEKSFAAFDQVLSYHDVACNLTFYETAMTHALLINHFKCNHPSQIKLIHQLPTSTGEFFNLYNPIKSQ